MRYHHIVQIYQHYLKSTLDWKYNLILTNIVCFKAIMDHHKGRILLLLETVSGKRETVIFTLYIVQGQDFVRVGTLYW